MKNALIAALVAAIVSAGSATAATTLIVNGKHIRNHSIPAYKLTRSALKRLRGHRGPRGYTGATGPTGATGAAGPQGPAGLIDLSKLHEVDGALVQVPALDQGTATATCPSGDKVVGGGYYFDQGNNNPQEVEALASAPKTDLSGWTVWIQSGGYASAIQAFAVCAAP